MTFDWPRELFNQFDLQWNLAHGPSLEAITDEEYLWEPVPGCWSIRPTGPGGRGEFEAWPDPEPVPVPTIAWRLSHLAVGVFGLRASHYFGDGSLTHENAERPLTAKEGVAYFKEQALLWRSRIERLDEEGLSRPVASRSTSQWRRSSSMSTERHSTTWRRCPCCGTSTGRLGARGSPDARMARCIPRRTSSRADLFTPACASWASPIEAQFGPIRTLVRAARITAITSCWPAGCRTTCAGATSTPATQASWRRPPRTSPHPQPAPATPGTAPAGARSRVRGPAGPPPSPVTGHRRELPRSPGHRCR